jgi:putative ABC transport system permease protein
MLKNYILIAWRNILKNPFYSLVNIVGLFIGIVFTLLIGAYIYGELSVNLKLKHSKNQYLLTSIWKDPNMGPNLTCLGPIAKRLKEDYPSLVANYYRWDGIGEVITKGDKNFRENIQIGDTTFLSMYGFNLIYGDSKTALKEPFSVIITNHIAQKYFGKTEVVGQTLKIQSNTGEKKDFKITGVLGEFPLNSVTSIDATYVNDILIPINTISYFKRQIDSWNVNIIPSYIELKEGVDPKSLAEPIRKLIRQNTSSIVYSNLQVKLVPLNTYYLTMNNGLVKRMLFTLSLIGLFILLMALINFININITRSTSRMKEIGIRKVLGGIKKELILQFMVESLLMVFLATLFALFAYPLLKPIFEGLVGKEIPTFSSFPLCFILIPIVFVTVTGILAGFYPSLVLSSFKSVDSLKGKLSSSVENIILRQGLVCFQLCIAIIILIFAGIITDQVSFFFSQQLGYSKEYVITSQVPRDWSKKGVVKMESIRREFSLMPQIENVTLSYEIPNGNLGGPPPVYKLGGDSTKGVSMLSINTDQNYLDTYKIKLKSGSFFDPKGQDSNKVILNEMAIHSLGWKNEEEAIGQQLRISKDPSIFTIKGVTEDFHVNNMNQKIAPLLFFNVNFSLGYRYLSFKIKPGDIVSTIDAIQKKWDTLLPGSSFEYSFMDDILRSLYASELQLRKATYTATVIAILITLLGILGLVSLSIQKRMKEIGIRKVLGASISTILNLFIKDFLVLIGIASLISIPISYLISEAWLNSYAYRIPITPYPFLVSIISLALMTLLLIGLHSLKAAFTNPIKSLQTE